MSKEIKILRSDGTIFRCREFWVDGFCFHDEIEIIQPTLFYWMRAIGPRYSYYNR